MRFAATLAVLASVGFTAAQSSAASVASAAQPTSTSTCLAQNIVDACVASIQPQISACSGTDWICLCQQYQNLLTCYNNCPNDPEKSTVQSQVTSYCTAAAPLLSASAASAATMPHPSTTATTASGASGASTLATTTTGAAAGTASGTQSGAKASSTGAAGFIAAPVSGAVAVFLGLAGLL
ncbi:hypothetical protein AOQ84DRAFT_156349 [Glonium stellatum]|uniref:GPI anchored serine-threonine rich protein n=1 Tax=Glonium stellatum TaxID=574774 RepID=A0A8E2F971_9PEZI|nr:hypothetical protein AOQ84DRAFT_156349 [Glonium stellatum]